MWLRYTCWVTLVAPPNQEVRPRCSAALWVGTGEPVRRSRQRIRSVQAGFLFLALVVKSRTVTECQNKMRRVWARRWTNLVSYVWVPTSNLYVGGNLSGPSLKPSRMDSVFFAMLSCGEQKGRFVLQHPLLVVVTRRHTNGRTVDTLWVEKASRGASPDLAPTAEAAYYCRWHISPHGCRNLQYGNLNPRTKTPHWGKIKKRRWWCGVK